MNGPSKITADYSSIVGLKAELLRKRQEARELKSKNPTQNPIKHHKPKVKAKKSKEITSKEDEEKSPKVIEIEDINKLKQSKLMLEAKARLYNKLQKSGENNDNFLVDFSQKSDENSEKSDNEEDLSEVNYDSDDNFVEYKDCFGRTRKCLREDLPRMQDKDNLLRQQMSKEPIPDKPEEKEIEQKPVQLEPEIEIMRKKWEEQANRLTNKDNIYYQDVLFDEARAHGVGYYNFSIDEEERAKQQENLEKLRKDTEQKQKEMQDLKQMRQKMERNRLRVARIRQRIRAGLPAELSEEEDEEGGKNLEEGGVIENKEKSEEGVESKESNEKVAEGENSLAVIEDKVKAFGELLGKRLPWREMSQEEWVKKRRKDRLSEFAPTYGFKSAGYLEISNSVSENLKEVFKEDNIAEGGTNDCEVIGPFPMSGHEQSTNPEEENCDESNDSDIIGPMPFVDSPASIPLPPNPQLSTIPLPPSPKESMSNFPVHNVHSKEKSSIDTENIAAGLRYLRERFEDEKKY